MNNEIEILGHKIGKNNPCYIIAEIGINHNGKLELAKQLIDVAIKAGADAVKFQKRDLEEIYKKSALEDPNSESQGFEILLEVLKEVEFDKNEYNEIIEHCKNNNIAFLCTPWDKKSVEFLEGFNVPAYKISSADMTNFPLIDFICKKNKPFFISTGMSSMEEIEKTVKFVKSKKIPFVLMHSNSTYPAPIDSLNLTLIPELEEKFDVNIGYSGHEQGIISTVVARVLGANVIERHLTLDKTMPGLDHAASLDPEEFIQLVKMIREAEKSLGVSKKSMTRGEILQRELLAKSIVSSKDISSEEKFSEENIEVKGPAKGISPQYYYEIIGKNSTRKIKKGEYLSEQDYDFRNESTKT